jgi:hypothetical protein
MREIETYTAKELAGKLKVPYRIILNAIRKKELRCICYSPKYRRIRSEDAARWIQSITS